MDVKLINWCYGHASISKADKHTITSAMTTTEAKTKEVNYSGNCENDVKLNENTLACWLSKLSISNILETA